MSRFYVYPMINKFSMLVVLFLCSVLFCQANDHKYVNYQAIKTEFLQAKQKNDTDLLTKIAVDIKIRFNEVIDWSRAISARDKNILKKTLSVATTDNLHYEIIVLLIDLLNLRISNDSSSIKKLKVVELITEFEEYIILKIQENREKKQIHKEKAKHEHSIMILTRIFKEIMPKMIAPRLIDCLPSVNVEKIVRMLSLISLTGAMLASIAAVCLSLDQQGFINFKTNKIGQVSVLESVKFDDIVGMDEAKKEMNSLMNRLLNQDIYKAMNLGFPNGILLVGPPGVGKTMIAKAMAYQGGFPFKYVAATELSSKWVGGSAQRVRNLFENAEEEAEAEGKPCIIFIDEIDAIKSAWGANSELLTQMDGFQKKNVLVLAATNYPNGLDQTLTRAGRFNTVIEVKLPNKDERKQILEQYFKKIELKYREEKFDFNSLAAQTDNFNSASLKELISRAAKKYADKLVVSNKESFKKLNEEDFSKALTELKEEEQVRHREYVN